MNGPSESSNHASPDYFERHLDSTIKASRPGAPLGTGTHLCGCGPAIQMERLYL